METRPRILGLGAAALLALALAGCTGTGGPNPSVSGASSTVASGTAGTTSSAPPFSAPGTVGTTASAPGTAGTTSAPAPPASVSPVTAPLTIYYVAMSDNGTSGAQLGCGDSLVATQTEPVTTADRLRASMERLLADKDQFHGQSGLYNALYQSSLQYQSGSVSADTVTVQLTGQLIQGGECDSPRVKAQLEQTALTASGAGKALITIDGKSLDSVLSLK